MQVKEINDVKIIDINSEGWGVGRSEAFPKVLFVKDTIPGETVSVIITKEEKGFARAQLTNLIKPSPERRTPPCKHFDLCGGCSLQHISYEAQLIFKQKQVESALIKIAKIENPNILPIIASPFEFQYRNKMEFHFSSMSWIVNATNEKLQIKGMERRALGLFPAGRFDRILNIDECHLHMPILNDIRNFIYRFCLEENITFYDPKLKKGLMRELIFRTNSKQEIFLICLFRESPGIFQTKLFLELEKAFPQITSLYYGINKNLEGTFIEDIKLIAFKGEQYFFETILQTSFKINAKSFFQMNIEQTQNLAKKVIELGEFEKHQIVYDLYCGVGVFGILIAPLVKKVIGVESSMPAYKDANDNAALLSQKNIKFVKGEALSVLTNDFIEEYTKADIIIIDPPRAGLEKTLCQRLLELAVQKIIYISCNPASLARDISLLKEKYTLKAALPIDMFPQTSHIETICLLTLL